MQAQHKKILKAISLEMRHLFEGSFDSDGVWHPGDLEQRLAAIGVRRDRDPVGVDDLPHLSDDDKYARQVVDAYLRLRAEADVTREEAVAEFVRETAYTWANRLLCLRCMEARELIDEVILQKDAYGGRSLEHHRLAQRQPELCAGEDDGRFAVLDKVFAERAQTLPLLFDPQAPGVALKPSPAALKRALRMLSGTETVRNLEPATGEVFQAPDALGWAYQYWNTEEKDRVFAQGGKIAGADIIPATQLYTEPYMVKFLVQNSLGATWMTMNPESNLCENWEYYVPDADRLTVEKKPVAEITFLDPACGSGHFLLEAFDLYYAMYVEEGELTKPEDICQAILEKNLFGIDIDARAVQIAEAALWMKAAERAFDFEGGATNLVAAVASHLKGDLWEEFLAGFEREPSVARVLRRFGQAMEHIDELGSLARPDDELRAIIHEEHAVWEGQVRERKEANYLFPEMVEDALSGHLPFPEISEKEFGKRLLYRARTAINGFIAESREQRPFQDQFLGRETSEGFKLLALLGKKYDVVAANPPYMGTKTMPRSLQRHLSQSYPDGKRDLFVGFMLRCSELCGTTSRVAMVTQQSWMFASGLGPFRGASAGSEGGNGFLTRCTILSLAHIGPGGFTEISGEVVNSVLVVFMPTPPTHANRMNAIRTVEARDPTEKARILRERPCKSTFVITQTTLLRLPNAPVAYWLPTAFVDLVSRPERVQDEADVLPGLKTGEDARFLRFHWEAPPRNKGWIPYSKGGSGYGKWYGQNEYCLDWRNEKTPFRQYKDSRQPYSEFYFRDGYTFSGASKGALGVRKLIPGSICGAKGPGVYPKNGIWPVSVLNSRLCSYLIRAMTVGLDILVENVRAVPLPASDRECQSRLESCATASEALRSIAESGEPTDRGFLRCSNPVEVMAADACLLVLELSAEQVVASMYGLDENALSVAYEDVGMPAARSPVIRGYDTLPEISDDVFGMPVFVVNEVATTEQLALDDKGLEALRTRLKTEFEKGPGAKRADVNKASACSQEKDSELAHGIPLPTETFVEDLARRLEVHPVSIFNLLREGIEGGGWLCLSEKRRDMANRSTVAILRLLGHRWPRQIEAGEMVPEWADPDGIIPLTEGTDESTLLHRLRERIAVEFEEGDVTSIEREFAEIMDNLLEQWLSMEFFKYHIRRFKKRPIAWQIQSGKFTARKKPAFACLVYYHKFDSDLLPKIRTQYVGPLRQRMETEVCGIEQVAPDARSDRQEARRSELGDLIGELTDLNTLLREVRESGFQTKGLRQHAIEDALLCMKVRWLGRLAEAVADGPLPQWQNAATVAEVHEDMPGWIAEAMAHLDSHCTQVGPSEWTAKDDPHSETMAKLICKEAERMAVDAVSCANRRWWTRLDRIVLAPLREEISERRTRIKGMKREMEDNPDMSDVDVFTFKEELDRLTAEIRGFQNELDDFTDRAEGIRTAIADWRCPESLTWEPWLGVQPMYDMISTVDGRRQPPTTVPEWIFQEGAYVPDINDGVRVNIAPLQQAGLLAADVLSKKDVPKAIADRAQWRADERRWCREDKLPQPGWWPEPAHQSETDAPGGGE